MSAYLSAIAIAVFLVTLATLGFQTYRVNALNNELEGARQTAASNLAIANANAAVLERVKSDYNASLSACFSDYAILSDKFDSYRLAIAKNATKAIPSQEPRSTTCEIGASALSDALNGLR
jgi:hypothetical protein